MTEDLSGRRSTEGMARRSLLKWLGAAFAGAGAGLWRVAPAQAACTVFEGAVCYTQNDHVCISNAPYADCPSDDPMVPNDKWTKYVNSDDDPHTCSCLWVGCLSKHRCNGSRSSYWWMLFVGYTYCCDICS